MQTLDDEGTKLGTFLYDEDGDQVQTFKLSVSITPYDETHAHDSFLFHPQLIQYIVRVIVPVLFLSFDQLTLCSILVSQDNKQGVFNYVKLQVESNWGHPDYTCLYNFRVHGNLAE